MSRAGQKSNKQQMHIILIAKSFRCNRGLVWDDDYGQVAYPIFRIVDWAYWDGEQEAKRIGAPMSAEPDDALPF